MIKYLVMQIDPKLRMPMTNVHYPTTQNINYYSEIINDVTEGGADIISTSPGWTGHVAFVDPIPEFVGSGDIEEWLSQPAKIVKLSPMTILQNSLNGTFGQSGDIANVPPKAATIGPIDVMRAKERIEVHALATCGTFSSWQRVTSRLVTHGPDTPYVPSSMLQTKKTQVYISDELAAPFACWGKVGYKVFHMRKMCRKGFPFRHTAFGLYINLRESERALSFIRNFRVFRICRLKERLKNLQNHFCVFCNQGKTEQDPQHGYPQENIREKRQQQERK